MMSKRVVFWGVGIVCKMCLTGHPEVSPEFFIDSNYGKPEFQGKSVVHPSEIQEWNKYFVVATVKYPKVIFLLLDSYGLKEGVDYTDCFSFFNIVRRTPNNVFNGIRNRKDDARRLKGKSLIFAPMFESRASESLIIFFREYFQKRDYILIESLQLISEERAEDIMGIPVLDCPDSRDIKINATEIDEEKQAGIHTFIRQFEESRSNEAVSEDVISYSQGLYEYYEKLIKLLEPQNILIWGVWSRDSLFLEHIAKSSGIDYGFLEHGMIPGTIQFDRLGVAGSGEIARYPEKFRDRKAALPVADYDRIRDFIIDTHIDTGVFRSIEEDERQLLKLDGEKKTVFLVGMGETQMKIDGGSVFWKQYISSEVASTEEAYTNTVGICKKNGWQLLFKPHPGEKAEYCKEGISDPDIAIVRFAEIDRLIKLSDVVVTIASAVSYKVLFYEKPLVEIGKISLYGQGCSYEVKGDYEAQLKCAFFNGMNKEQKENFKNHVLMLLSYSHWDDMTHPDLPFGLGIEDDFFEKRETA